MHLFRDYPYFSSAIQTLQNDFVKYAYELAETYQPKKNKVNLNY